MTVLTEKKIERKPQIREILEKFEIHVFYNTGWVDKLKTRPVTKEELQEFIDSVEARKPNYMLGDKWELFGIKGHPFPSDNINPDNVLTIKIIPVDESGEVRIQDAPKGLPIHNQES